MRNLIILLFTCLVCAFPKNGKCQSYHVEIEQIPYDTLTEYTSLAHEKVEKMELPYWFDEHIEFGFEFPYFDTILTSILFDNWAVGDIEGCEEYPMYLFSNEWELYFEPNFLGHFDSDYRYKRTQIGNKNVFIFEFHRVLVEQGIDEIKFSKSDISYQIWFWENGDIELRFGKMFIDPSLYKPGIGLYDKALDGYYTIALQISNYNLTEIINITGNLNDHPTVKYLPKFDILFEGLTHVPNENTVCRFRKNPSKTDDQSPAIAIPNMVHDEINIPDEAIFQNYIIYDFLGNQLLSGTSKNINTQTLHTGAYILMLLDKTGTHSYKFIKV